MNIRTERPQDVRQIRAINSGAFETNAEADLVDALRTSAIPLISLVVEKNRMLIGHILFSPVNLSSNKAEVKIAGLAPMAVKPEYQRQGIGKALVQEGLKRCKSEGYQAVVVLGHPDYYPKFGFVPSSKFGIKSEFDVPDDVFMIIELERGCLSELGGGP
jgi:putative acetyltransferase